MSARPEADEANYPERRTVRTVDARPMRTSRLFDALPPYPGGKRRLVPLILADLAAELPAAEWPGASFCDPMCGGGAVALAAKAQGFEVYASDRARRGAIVAAALIANSSVRLREAGSVKSQGALRKRSWGSRRDRWASRRSHLREQRTSTRRKEPPLLSERHRVASPAAPAEVLPQLVERRAEARRRREAPEAAHRVVPLLHRAMVLLHEVV